MSYTIFFLFFFVSYGFESRQISLKKLKRYHFDHLFFWISYRIITI